MYRTYVLRVALAGVALLGSTAIAPAQINVCQSSPNSVGPGAIISSTGSLSITDNNFELTATGAVPNEHGIFFFGPARTHFPMGNGVLCVRRFRARFDMILTQSNGAASYSVDFGTSPGGLIVAGMSTYFQYQYRDPIGGGPKTFNFSDALRVVFTP
jgi:hypothetical protein